MSDSFNAVLRARNSDPLSSFGDFIALNNIVDEPTALILKNEVSDGIIAPYFTKDALNILKRKKGKYVILEQNLSFSEKDELEFREIHGWIIKIIMIILLIIRYLKI